MKLHELSPASGSVKENFRKGRGPGSGNGKTAGRGHKGLGQRAGGSVRPGFEGGQSPISVRVPKRGFSNARFATTYAIVNVGDLNIFDDGATVTAAELAGAGLTRKLYDGVKILGNGELTKKLNITAAACSDGARAKIEAAGGKIEVI